MGTWEHIKIGGAPHHNALGVLLLGEIPQNTHRNLKKGVISGIPIGILLDMFEFIYLLDKKGIFVEYMIFGPKNVQKLILKIKSLRECL
jgi:hypothetical protein